MFDGQYPLPFEHDFGALCSRIKAEHTRQLEKEGFVVVDNVFGEGWSRALLEEIKWLRATNMMLPNQIKFLEKDGSNYAVTKPNIYELDLHHDRREAVPELNELFWNAHTIAAHMNALLPMLQLRTKPGCHTLKVNDGAGGCFPLHYDNPAPPDKRRLTCLLYLNPDWKAGDGGELRVAPFLRAKTDIAPLLDRVAMFFSETVLHRVLPAAKARACLTIWFDSDVANDERHAPPWPGLDPADPTMRALSRPAVQRRFSRGVYDAEYEESIRECMRGDDEGAARLLASHRQHVAALRSNPGVAGLIDTLSVLKSPIS